jgi:hypothetical protein
MATCKLTLGCDAGNGFVKISANAVFSTQPQPINIKIPSYIQEVDGRTLEETPFPNTIDGAIVQYISGDRKDLQGTAWLCGTTAYNNFPNTRQAIVETSDGKVDYGLQLLLAALGQLGEKALPSGNYPTNLCVSVHDRQVYSKRIVGAYNGEHNVIVNDTPYTFIIKCGCVEEGMGAIYNLKSQGLVGTQQNIIVTDLGYGTTITQAYTRTTKGYETVPSSLLILKSGVYDLIKAIAHHESLVSAKGSRGDIEVIRTSIERYTAMKASGQTPTMYYGNTLIDIEPAYKASIKKWFNACLVKTAGAVEQWQHTSTNYIIGGGSKLPGLSSVLTEVNPLTGKPRYVLSAESQFINAIGLGKLAGTFK